MREYKVIDHVGAETQLTLKQVATCNKGRLALCVMYDKMACLVHFGGDMWLKRQANGTLLDSQEHFFDLLENCEIERCYHMYDGREFEIVDEGAQNEITLGQLDERKAERFSVVFTEKLLGETVAFVATSAPDVWRIHAQHHEQVVRAISLEEYFDWNSHARKIVGCYNLYEGVKK